MTRLEIAKQILDWEARRDKSGRLAVYPLPSGDGGGTFEVAGINDRYHPKIARSLAGLIGSGRHDEAEREAVEYIAEYTDGPGSWASTWQMELCLRDTAFNRGAGGAAKILQRALGVKIDGLVGPLTLAALRGEEETDLTGLVRRFRDAREWYERRYAHRDEQSKFWAGLTNRWHKCMCRALAV